MYDIWTVDVPMQRWPIANWLLITFIVVVSIFAWNMTDDGDARRLLQLIQELHEVQSKKRSAEGCPHQRGTQQDRTL